MSIQMQKFRRAMTAVVFALAAMILLAPRSARAEWPERPITIVVCFPAGGGTDTAMRLITKRLGEALHQSVVVENRGGAGGNIAISAVARAEPDGYTLLGCSSAFVVNPNLYQKVSYDPFKDFAPITVIGASPNVFAVPGKGPIKDFKDLVARAKAAPGKLNYSSSGIGTTPYLAAELIKQKLGINIVHIPFAGAGPGVQAAVAGQVDMVAASIGSLQSQIDGGALRGIAQTGKTRWPELADVPTLDELGVHGAESDTFQALYAPAKVPKPILDKLAKAAQTALADKDLQAQYLKTGLKVLAEPPDVFAARIAREVPLWKKVIDNGNLKLK
jgi:tripartite-type tricarboxylate transporter receptor subunit TctC